MALYQLTVSNVVIRTSDNAFIPTDPGNRDYQAYLVWAAAGNTADPSPTAPAQTMVSASDFLNRFTPEERLAVQTACLADAALSLGLTFGLALGTIDLTSTTCIAWMASLVTATAITQDRATVILTP